MNASFRSKISVMRSVSEMTKGISEFSTLNVRRIASVHLHLLSQLEMEHK